MKETVVIGIGNTIMKDDGVGVHAVKLLEGRVPSGVEVVEGSVYSPDLLSCIEGRKKAVFVDGIEAGEEPGAVFRFLESEVKRSTRDVSVSIHDYGLYDLITAAKLLDSCPDEVVLIAVQVKEIAPGEELSEELEAVLPGVCELILGELTGGGETSAGWET